MPERRRIFVGPDAQASGKDRAIRINGRNATFRIATERLSIRLVEPIPGRLLDLLEISAGVFAADGSIQRGGETRPNFGRAWRRQFDFRIDVREPDFWNRAAVRAQLSEVLDAISEDEARFSFAQSNAAPDAQVYFKFDQATHPAFQCDEVVLFSGGIDSLVGTLELLEAGKGRVALVTHLSANKRLPHLTGLVRRLQHRYPDRTLWLPVQARRSSTRGRETTQRTRSLLFTALAVVATRMLGGNRITFFENGIVSHNLPISNQVVGTMATRTTHPLGLRRLSELMRLVTGEAVTIENPFEWLTKTEVVSKLSGLDAEDLLEQTVSCSRVWERKALIPHCGECSQCLDRRFAVLAAGMAERDPAPGYETDVLLGERNSGPGRTVALDWTRHAAAMPDMNETAFMDRFGAEVMRIVEGFPEKPHVRTAAQIIGLHRRHGMAVRGVLQAATEKRAGEIVTGTLPKTSLLAMVVAQQNGGLASLDRAPRVQLAGPDDAGAEVPIFPLQVTLSGDLSKARALVRGLGPLSPAPSRVVAVLVPLNLADRAEARAPEDHRSMSGAEAARQLRATAGFVRQNVLRCRSELADYYFVIEGEPPPKDLLIERRPKGYLLDPECRVIRADQGPATASPPTVRSPAVNASRTSHRVSRGRGSRREKSSG